MSVSKLACSVFVFQGLMIWACSLSVVGIKGVADSRLCALCGFYCGSDRGLLQWGNVDALHVFADGFCCSLQALKVLRTAEFAPFVVFIAAPSMATLAELKNNINVSALSPQPPRHVPRSYSVCSTVVITFLLGFTTTPPGTSSPSRSNPSYHYSGLQKQITFEGSPNPFEQNHFELLSLSWE